MKTSLNLAWGRAGKLCRLVITASLVWSVLLLANGCLTHKDVRLRTKSIKEWEARQEKERERMPDTVQTSTVCTPLPQEGLDGLLTLDYEHLSAFSKDVRKYGITQNRFNQMFWEGVTKSYDFYQSSEYIDQKLLTNLINRNLLTNPNLVNPQANPGVAKASIAKAFASLNRFSGEWHGKWKDIRVHHFWLPIRECKESFSLGCSLVGFQSCFIGDGIGWNFVVEEKGRTVVLGFVYHFNNDGALSAKNPHYAFLNPDNQLTWVSDDHIYFEFVRNQTALTNKKQYVITGAQYEKQQKEMKLISGFQAVYLSEDQRLPVFKQFQVSKARVIEESLIRPLRTIMKGLIKSMFSADSIL